MGFEPTRAEHNGLAVHRLNHSATSSSYFRYLARFISKFILGNSLFQRERRLGDGLETSGRRGDGPFSHEWTKNWIGKPATGEKKKKPTHLRGPSFLFSRCRQGAPQHQVRVCCHRLASGEPGPAPPGRSRKDRREQWFPKPVLLESLSGKLAKVDS